MKELNRHIGAALLAAPFFCGLMVAGCHTEADAPTLHVQAVEGFPTEEPGIEQGVSAAYAALSGHTLWMAGGCNFPEVPAAEGGKKRFYQGIYLADIATDTLLQWRQAGLLPQAAAYGVAVATADGMVCVGGTGEQGALATAYRLRLSAEGDSIVTETLPSLPFTLDNATGTLSGQTLYVAGGNADGRPSNILMALDLTQPEAGWRRLPDFPGPPRTQAVCAALSHEGTPCLYLWGGFAASAPDREASLSTDGYLYDTATATWHPLAAPTDEAGTPLSLGGGTACAWGDDAILCTGGVHAGLFLSALQREALLREAVAKGNTACADSLRQAGRDYLSMPEEAYQFNHRLLLYHASQARWEVVGASPRVARAGASLVGNASRCYLLGGERKPGIRAAEVSLLTPGK